MSVPAQPGVFKSSDPDFLAYRNRVKNREHLSVVRGVNFYRQEVDELLDTPLEMRGTCLPWSKTSDQVRLRPGELSLWAGKNAHGKSTLLSQVLVWMATVGEPVMVASFEMPVASTIERMLKQATGCVHPSEALRDEFFEKLSGKLYFYDYLGKVDADLVLDLCEFSADVLGCKHIQIDSLSKVKGMLSERNEQQADFVNDLHASAKYFNTHIHLVAHERKGGPDSESKVSTRYEIKGSGAIPDQVDNVFIVWMDKNKKQKQEQDESKPDVYIRVDKQRHALWEGYIALYLSKRANFQFLPTANQRAIQFPGMT